MIVGVHWYGGHMMVGYTMVEDADEHYDVHGGEGYVYSHPGCITLEQYHTQSRYGGAAYPGADGT